MEGSGIARTVDSRAWRPTNRQRAETGAAVQPFAVVSVLDSEDPNDARICIASVFSAQQDGGLPLESLANRSLAVQPRKEIAKRFLDWHRNNVYLGTAE